MSMSVPSRWWSVLATAFGAVLLAHAVLGAMIGGGESSVAVVGAMGAAVSGVLVLGGLVRMRSSPITGSRLVVIGSALTLLGGVEVIPIAVVVVVSGLWTGNLRLSDTSDAPEVAPVTRHQEEVTRLWWAWLVVAAGLFAIGWLPLVFDDPDDLTFGGWYTWILSWLGAAVTGGIGVILGTLRLVVRHRTRLI